jgi:hypothetical protein
LLKDRKPYRVELAEHSRAGSQQEVASEIALRCGLAASSKTFSCQQGPDNLVLTNAAREWDQEKNVCATDVGPHRRKYVTQ